MKKRLERDHENVLISGVISGLAKYFEQDPNLFRLIAIALLIFTGFFPGVLVYFIAWLMMPRSAPRSEKTQADYEIVE